MNLAGIGILIPGAGEFGARCAALLREHGARVWHSPVLEFRQPDAPARARLADAVARLRTGGYDWLVVTSPRGVAALRDAAGDAGLRVAAGVRVAAVGVATRRALERLGVAVDVVPQQESASGLLAQWPSGDAAGRVLLPVSNLAHSTLPEGLRARGYMVDRLDAYLTVTVPLAPDVRGALAAGKIHAVWVTSGSVASALAEPLRAYPQLCIVSLGPQTSADLRALGCLPAAQAQRRTAESLLEAFVSTLELS